MEARSKIRNVSVAPRKARLVADLVRNQYVEDALSQLRFTHKAASPIIYKLIQSATANAQYQDPNIDITNLYVKEIRVDEGITRKWIRPRARGMANRILKRSSHIIVVVDEESSENGE
ncbi:MAG: 50S ribosomal protein L22 [Candidatus Poribacteria bacterium]|nr:50S ribosomal protein L22 [Candidatus Poribacteria bacterium]